MVKCLPLKKKPLGIYLCTTLHTLFCMLATRYRRLSTSSGSLQPKLTVTKSHSRQHKAGPQIIETKLYNIILLATIHYVSTRISNGIQKIVDMLIKTQNE